MRTISFLLREPAVLQLGWALVHFLWEGSIIALLLAAALRLLARLSQTMIAAACAEQLGPQMSHGRSTGHRCILPFTREAL
jgi:uncharacterized membrane protein